MNISETLTHYIPLIEGVSLFILGLLFLWLQRRESKRREQEFVTVVTHKFRTPLTGIKWAIEMLQKDITYKEKDDILKQVEDANSRLLEIIDLLTSYIGSDEKFNYEFEVTSLRELVDESLRKYAQAVRLKNIKFEVGSDQTLASVKADKHKLQFVIDMLIDNAVSYTPQGGTIEVFFIQKGRTITIGVADTGMGMSRGDLRKLFKSFSRSDRARSANTEGMGLGLYTAKSIIERHGGKIWAESPGRNKGSTFFVRLKILETK